MLGRDGFRFGVIEYHSLREAGPVFAQIAEPVARYLDIRPVDAAEMVYYHRILENAP